MIVTGVLSLCRHGSNVLLCGSVWRMVLYCIVTTFGIPVL